MTVIKVIVIVRRIPEHFRLHFSDFFMIFYLIYNLQLLILVFMYVFHLVPWILVSSPWILVSSHGKSLAEKNRGGERRAVSDEIAHRRWGYRGGK